MAKITGKSILDTELGKMIEEEVHKQYKKGVGIKEAIKIGTRIAVNAWRNKIADKSGG